jgi:hypothetical protein
MTWLLNTSEFIDETSRAPGVGCSAENGGALGVRLRKPPKHSDKNPK